MSKRLRASLASKRGRMLRPRSERASSAGIATDGVSADGESQENFDDDRGSIAPAEEAAERASEIPESALDVPAVAKTVEPAPVQAAVEEVVPAPEPTIEPPPPPVVAAPAPDQVVPAPVETAELKSEPSNLETGPAVAVAAEPATEPVLAAPEPVKAAPVEALVAEPAAPAQVQTPDVAAATSTPAAAASEERGGKKKKKKKGDKGARAEAPRTIEAAAPAPEVETAADRAAKDGPPRETSSTPLAFAGEDDHDLSISNHHFFSSPEIVDHASPVIEDDQPRYIPPTAEEIARQTRLKRIVGGVVGVAALVAVVSVGKMVLGSKPADAMPSSSPSSPAAKVVPAKTEDPKPAVTATQAAAPLATPAPSTDTSAAPAESASAAPSASASADAPPAGEQKTPEEIKKLDIRCAQLGNGTDMKKAVETCREAIAAGTTDGMTYMYLYNSLLTLGKGGEAREALNDCVTNAVKSKGECAQWGGKKKQ